jgi:hypothetical protein
VLETPEEIEHLQQLLDGSAAGTGPHMRDIITDERRLTARQVHGSFWFSSGANSVRMRHLAARPAVTATYLPGKEVAVTLPLQGHGFQEWLDKDDTIRAARIAADKMFTFGMET